MVRFVRSCTNSNECPLWPAVRLNQPGPYSKCPRWTVKFVRSAASSSQPTASTPLFFSHGSADG